MLQFFRKYQKFFFLFTTMIIVVSFVFFGTFQVLTPSANKMKETAFTTLANKKVSRGDLFTFVRFLGFEGEQNPFNDGVISGDFLETGLGAKLFTHYREEIAADLRLRTQKEKSYVPYVHPEVGELSAKSGWEIFAPEILTHLPSFQANDDLSSDESFYDRTQLYLAQRKFPGSMLKQFLFYKSQDFEECNPDPRFYRSDLSLFGYKTASDWFGPKFVEGIAEVILNGAALAKQRGYTVSREEVVTDLMIRCHSIVDANKGQISMSGGEFYFASLKRLQLPEERLVSIWRDVLLFRRLLQDVGNGVWMDTVPLDEFFGFANEFATLEVYALPTSFCFSTKTQWQEFETYIDLVGINRDEAFLSTAMASIDQIEALAPELVSQKYTVSVVTAEKKALEAKVGFKEMWQWESMPDGWSAILERFPNLQGMNPNTEEARMAALDALEDKTRTLIDDFARKEIVNSHPEWITELLVRTEPVRRVFYFREGQTQAPLEGISDTTAFVKAIEASGAQKIESYTQDDNTYFSLELEEKGEKRVLSFVEASKEGVLSELLERKLRNHYLQLRETMPSILKAEMGTWKSFNDCKDLVVNDYFADLHHFLSKYKPKTIAQSRFLPYLEGKREQILAGIEDEGDFEWSSSKRMVTITRATPDLVTLEECQTLGEGELSDLAISSKEGPYFYRILEQKRDVSFPLTSLLEVEKALGNELKAHFFEDLLDKIESKGAISFSP